MIRLETLAQYTIYVYRAFKGKSRYETMSEMDIRSNILKRGDKFIPKMMSEALQKMVEAGTLVESYNPSQNLFNAVYTLPPVDDHTRKAITGAIKRTVKRDATWRGVFVSDLPGLLPYYDATAVTVIALSLAASGKVPHTVGTHGVKLLCK